MPVYKQYVTDNQIRKMRHDMLSNFWCEIQRVKHMTQFHSLHWSEDMFTFDQLGAELLPGNYLITLFARGTPIMCSQFRVRKSTRTIIAIWVGGINPRKPKGKSGIKTFHGDIKTMLGFAEQGHLSAPAIARLLGSDM